MFQINLGKDDFSDSSTAGDVDSSDEETPKVKFLNMNPLLPIYQEGRKTGMETIKVVELLLQPNEDAVARVVPTSVSMNASFVVDTNAPHVIHFKNILADDLGAWATNGTKKLYFRASTKTKPVMKADEVSFKNLQKNRFIYQATRMYFRNKSSPDLQKIVVYLTGRCKTNLKRVLHDQLKTI